MGSFIISGHTSSSICVWAKRSILKLEEHNAGDIVKCTARNDYGIDEQIIKIIKIKQLTSPRFKTEKPIISPDGKKAKLEWFPVEGANSYKVRQDDVSVYMVEK